MRSIHYSISRFLQYAYSHSFRLYDHSKSSSQPNDNVIHKRQYGISTSLMPQNPDRQQASFQTLCQVQENILLLPRVSASRPGKATRPSAELPTSHRLHSTQSLTLSSLALRSFPSQPLMVAIGLTVNQKNIPSNYSLTHIA